MCSGRASRTSSSPPATATAARYVAAWMRSATVRWSAAFSDPRSTPLTTMRDVPMPLMSAPMSTSRSHMSTTSGSRAALSIVVVPSANTAAVTMFSVAPTLGNEKAISAPWRRSAVACSSPWANLNEAPIASRPATCMSIGRAPKSSPPGIDRRTSPQRVNSGPSTLIDARIRSTSSYGAMGTRSPSFSRISCPGSGQRVRTPRAASNSPMIATSSIAGTLVSSYFPSASRLAAINLSTAFFAPGTRIVPSSGPRWRIVIWSGGVSPRQSLERQYAPAVRGREHGWQVTRSWPAGGATAEHVLSPRDDIVRERADGDGRFSQEAGPFTDYERAGQPRR